LQQRNKALNDSAPHILDRLFAVMEERKNAPSDSSYVASLHEKGIDKISGKLAEETAETIIEAVRGDSGKLASESADLLFHLMVLWSHAGIVPADVFAVLEKRFGKSGITEKNTRSKLH
jgi:phosphoribosyl-ATP pyrophosphohydrolase